MNHQMSCLRKCLWAFCTRIWDLPECVLWCIFRRPVENISWGLQCLYGLKSIVPHWTLIKVNISTLEIGSNFHAHFCDFLEIGWKIFFHQWKLIDFSHTPKWKNGSLKRSPVQHIDVSWDLSVTFANKHSNGEITNNTCRGNS